MSSLLGNKITLQNRTPKSSFMFCKLLFKSIMSSDCVSCFGKVPDPSTDAPTTFHMIYKLVKQLGAGGYGKVWLVQHIANRTYHAAKMVPDKKCRRKTWCEKRREYVPDEAVFWEPLDHPNIIKLQEVYYEAKLKLWIYIMEHDPHYIDIFALTEYTGTLSIEDTKCILRQTVGVCSYLIGEGIDHRDIKDENIMWSPIKKQIKLIDFGSASVYNSSTPYNIFQVIFNLIQSIFRKEPTS